MENKVLVVGGAGYIGGAVTDFLLERKVPFTVYDSLVYEDRYLKPVDFICGDVRDREKLKSILPNYSHVIWLAAIVGDGACAVRPELTTEINRDAVKWLADNYNGRIVFASTCSVYGKSDGELDESSAPNPLSLYAETKQEAEKILEKKNALIFRLGTVFGVSDTYSRLRMDLVLNYMTANAVTKGKLSVFGGAQWRPLMHVRNVAEAMAYNFDKTMTGIYNLATINYQIKDLAEEVARVTGCEIELTGNQFEDQRNYHVSTEKAKKAGLLDLKKVYTVEDGIKQIYDLVKTGRVKYTENDIYFNVRHITNLNKDGNLK